jgi:hypothetical protein
VVSSMFEINISACHLWGRGFDSRSKRATLWQRRFPPGSGFPRGSGFLHYIANRSILSMVDAQLSFQCLN